MKERVKNFLSKGKKVVVGMVVACSAIIASCATVFASGETSGTGITNINTALGNGLSTASDNIMSGISTVLPYALPVLAAILVVVIGIRVFKKVAK